MEIKKIVSKYLFLGSGLIIIFSALFLGFYSSKQTTLPPKPKQIQTPSPTPTLQPLPTTPPDKQIQGQIIIKFKQTYTQQQIAEHIKQYNATILKQIEGINYTVIKVPVGQENKIIEEMKSDPYVEKASGDYTNHTTYIPNDPEFQEQYFFNNIGQTINGRVGKAHADVNIEQAWDITRGNGVKVAILDSGIDLNHPEFANKIVGQKQFAATTIDPAIQDIHGHGTHVAGIVAANTNNASGVAGTCPECQLLIGKVVTTDLSGDATGATSDITAGITWAADQGAKVINLSLRTTTAASAPLYQAAIDYAISKGAVVVVAAGNDGTNTLVWPAANANVVSVAATDNQDIVASFSNYGSYVRVAAPGVSILSTLPTTPNTKNVLNYGYSSGTSMASPIVSGVVALIWTTPYGTSPETVMNRLYTTADKINGTGTYWTEGRINASKAVGSVVTPTTNTISIFPSAYCMGGVGVPPCATIYPSPTVTPTQIPSPLPTTLQTASPVLSQPYIPPPSQYISPTLSQVLRPPLSRNPVIAKLFTQLCPALSQTTYASGNDASIQHRKNHRKHHRKNHHGHSNNGIFSRMLEMLIKLIESLLKQLGVENPCIVKN